MDTSPSPYELKTRTDRSSRWKSVLFLAAALVVIHAAIASIGWNNPILEQHGFRQTQTAISSYWLLRGSPVLAYETPVLGPPWSIPFEFPLYQVTVALWSKWTHMPLDQSGRTISLLCFYACLLCAGWLIRGLRLPAVCFAMFSILYLTSPLYLFWSRAFMIETMALTASFGYLTLAAVAVISPDRKSLLWSAAALGSIAAIVKVTTFAGPLLVVCAGYLIYWLKTRPSVSQVGSIVGLAIAVPVGFELWWERLSDATRIRNPLQFMSSSELTHWIFGSPLFRVSGEFWSRIYNRMLPDMLGAGWAVVALFCVGLWLFQERKVQILTAGLFAAFWVPTVLFANLHFVHNYYQCGTAAYLYMGIAIVIGAAWRGNTKQRAACIVLLAVLVSGNAYRYYVSFYPSLSPRRYPMLEVARYVDANIARSDVVLVYGSDWDPTVAYYSGRRAIMDRLYRPLASAQMQDAISGLNPNQHVGSVVACGTATHGWYLDRVQQSVAAIGLRREPAFDDGECRAYTGPSGAPLPMPGDPQSDDSWLRTPEAEMTRLLQGGALDHIVPAGSAANLLPLAPIEGPHENLAILASPDSVMTVRIPDHASSLTLSYGIKPFAWQIHHAGAVEFAVAIVRGADNAGIWKRTLDPGHQRNEAGEQVTVLQLPPGGAQLILTTRSSDRGVHQRSYWSGIQFH